MNTLVVPTNRPDCLADFLDAWRPWPWDHLIVVEDAPHVSTTAAADGVTRCSWREIDRELPNPRIISRRDSAIRAFGFWKAWCMGADVIFTLDDDCYPVEDGRAFIEAHLRNLRETPRWQSTVPGLRVRGLPYANAGTLDNVRLSVGLWTGHPDLDAVQTLAGRRPGDPVIDRGVRSRVMPGDQYFPMCGMNLAFTRDVACLLYYPPMGAGSPYARFDDIWGGLVLQKIFRHLRYSAVCGEPLVNHRRASNPFVNLVKEAPGIRASEDIWPLIDAVDLHARDPLGCMREMGAALCQSDRADEYVHRWGGSILEWCALFDGRGRNRAGAAQ